MLGRWSPNPSGSHRTTPRVGPVVGGVLVVDGYFCDAFCETWKALSLAGVRAVSWRPAFRSSFGAAVRG